ncbi:MAG: heavy metal translocating P-type ATPase [Herbinix sp.]|jgi:Cd2+/Zn2+-exporting ATPase|nr:heavy metal translocating P-type ATPase [Herbinix sp.]
MGMENKEYILDGLCCANCAAKIEKEVSNLSGVTEASINMMNNKLSIALQDTGVTDITKKVKTIVASHEPSVKVLDLTEKEEMDKQPASNKKQEAEEEMRTYFLRLGIAVALAIIFSVVNVSNGMKTAFFIVAYILAGYEVLSAAIKNIRKGDIFDENFLMGIASLGAFLIGERVEAIAVLVFYGVGELLQEKAVNKSKKDIAGLMNIRPDYANKITGDTISVVAPEQIEVGDLILVKPGEKVPLDGIVVKGTSFIDSRALTGESVPIEVEVEDTVLSGTINTSGVLEIKVTKPFGEATVSKILELVENASSKKAESEKFITKFARYYTPIVVFAAVAVAVVPPLLGYGTFTNWLYRALSFLIISCPCALVISIPLSFFGGIGGAAKQGILIKGGNYLDALKMVDTIVFDKTGTLTKGVFKVTKVCPTEGVDIDQLIYSAAIAENHSTHPIAKSILSYYNKNNNSNDIETLSIETAQITELAGHGVVAECGEYVIYAGNEKLMRKFDILTPLTEATGSIVHVAKNNKYLGYILISDEIKSGVKETMIALKQLGVKHTVMLTGDHTNTAKEIAELCQVDEYQAELLPQDKVAWFEKYKKQAAGKGKIVFVGDGINDAPVLAGADIGIAMGGIGSDAAIEAADVVIMNDEISKIATAIKIAHKTKSIVTQNIIFALGIKALIMVLAFLDITSIWFAIFADVGVALIALFNAMRAMRIK